MPVILVFDNCTHLEDTELHRYGECKPYLKKLELEEIIESLTLTLYLDFLDLLTENSSEYFESVRIVIILQAESFFDFGK